MGVKSVTFGCCGGNLMDDRCLRVLLWGKWVVLQRQKVILVLDLPVQNSIAYFGSGVFIVVRPTTLGA